MMVPFHLSFILASERAAPMNADIWMSCPHPCITATSWPLSFFVVTLLA
jgi:hypothetical protein